MATDTNNVARTMIVIKTRNSLEKSIFLTSTGGTLTLSFSDWFAMLFI
jgi:hypothetical protein